MEMDGLRLRKTAPDILQVFRSELPLSLVKWTDWNAGVIPQPFKRLQVVDGLYRDKNTTRLQPTQQPRHHSFKRKTMVQHGECDDDVHRPGLDILNHPTQRLNALRDAVQFCSPSRRIK